MVSCDLTGKAQFRFSGDDRHIIAFVAAEGEYRSNQRLPEFARELLLNEGVNCEFALGEPFREGEFRHNIENLQILNDADLAIFSVRRRALDADKMDLIRNFVNSDRPILGIRTSSHAFDVRNKIPREIKGLADVEGKDTLYLDQWPEFDERVLGGNYQGHYGHLQKSSRIGIVPGMQGHPILRGFPSEGYMSPSWLYRNTPLRSENIQVLLTGSIPGQSPEPVLWINQPDEHTVIYTSLGHWDDWEAEGFRQIILNSVRYLLKKQ
jgi:hypothetical protein